MKIKRVVIEIKKKQQQFFELRGPETNISLIFCNEIVYDH